MDKPLEGVKVVEFSYFVAGPSTAMNLADWGAEVIKVEPPFGDPGHRRDENGKITVRDEYFNVYNRHKKDIVLNTKDPRGLEITYKLLEDADVFMTSFRPNALKKMGLDWETVHKKFPKVIYANITGFGEEGPDKDDPGFDTVAFWGRSGLTQDIINRGNDVLIPPVAFGDLLAGSVLAGAIGTALYHRERTGEAEKVSLALYSLGLYALSYLVFDVQTGGSYPMSRFEPALPMMATFKCKDGEWLYMANVDHEKHYNDLMHALGREDMVDNPKFASRTACQKNKVEFIKEMDKEFAKYTRPEAMDLLTSVDIAYSPIRHVKDNIDDPQALANDFLLPMNMRDGITALVPSTPIRYGGMEMESVGMPPLMGQDTFEVLKEAGYSDDDLKTFLDEKVILTNAEVQGK